MVPGVPLRHIETGQFHLLQRSVKHLVVVVFVIFLVENYPVVGVGVEFRCQGSGKASARFWSCYVTHSGRRPSNGCGSGRGHWSNPSSE